MVVSVFAARLFQLQGIDANLMVLAVGAGSLMCSHVNDAGFWLFKEYFNVSLLDTFSGRSLAPLQVRQATSRMYCSSRSRAPSDSASL